MNFLSHMLVLLLTLAAGFPAGSPCAPAHDEACGGHGDTAGASMPGDQCAQACRQRGADARCETTAGETEPAVRTETQPQPSGDVAVLSRAGFTAGHRHLLLIHSAGQGRASGSTSLQTQHVRLQV